MKMFFKYSKRNFSKLYDGIEGDVNWKGGKMIDGRPHIYNHKYNLPKKRYGKFSYNNQIDFTEFLKDLDNPRYITYGLNGKGLSPDIGDADPNKK
jgi:hypothetical protein